MNLKIKPSRQSKDSGRVLKILKNLHSFILNKCFFYLIENISSFSFPMAKVFHIYFLCNTFNQTIGLSKIINFGSLLAKLKRKF